MFDHIFENRNKKLVNILKIADYLGRSLRENVEVFSIDDSTQETIFITENDKIIKGNYDFSNGISLQNIIIEDSDIFSDDEQFDSFVTTKVSSFIKNIYDDEFVEAEDSFDNILNLWESRAKFFNVKHRLFEKREKLHARQGVIATEPYQRFVEIAPLVVDFLTENRESIESIPEVRNSIMLSNTISQAFECPRVDYEVLEEVGQYDVNETHRKSIYEMICSQELVRKELFETKVDFANIWVNEEKITQLAGCVFEKDEAIVEKCLIEAVGQIPYLALASKKELRTVITNSLELQESALVSKKELNSYVSYLFETKKPIKTLFIRSLNEKYGVNVQNLKEIPSFKSLANTQVVLFECLSKIAPKNSTIKEVLKETAKLLKNRDGVECLDVNEDIKFLFSEAKFSDLEPENDIETLEFDNISSYCSNIDELVELLSNRKQVNEDEIPEYDEDRVEDVDQEKKEKDNEGEEQEDIPEYDETRLAVDGAEVVNVYPEEEDPRVDEQEPKKAAVAEKEPEEEAEEEEKPEEEPKAKKEEAPEEEEKPQRREIDPDEYMKALKELEDTLSNLDISGDNEEEEEE